MATDYDAPRKTDDELSEDSIEELKSRRVDKRASSVDVDETEQAEGFELPGADLSGEELSVRVLPRQADEFTCSPGASSCTTAAGWRARSPACSSAGSAPPEGRQPDARSGDQRPAFPLGPCCGDPEARVARRTAPTVTPAPT